MRVITPGLMQRVEALLSRLLLLVCLRMEVGAGWHLGPGLGIAESRLTSQPKAAPSHEWAPPPATSHIPMPIVLYTQQRTRIPFIFPITKYWPCLCGFGRRPVCPSKYEKFVSFQK